MDFDITKICDGLDIGEGSISGAVVAKDAGTEMMVRVDEAINSPAILAETMTACSLTMMAAATVVLLKWLCVVTNYCTVH